MLVGRGDRALDRRRDVVKLQVEKDARPQRGNIPDDRGPFSSSRLASVTSATTMWWSPCSTMLVTLHSTAAIAATARGRSTAHQGLQPWRRASRAPRRRPAPGRHLVADLRDPAAVDRLADDAWGRGLDVEALYGDVLRDGIGSRSPHRERRVLGSRARTAPLRVTHTSSPKCDSRAT